MNIKNLPRRIYKNTIFFVGDIRKLHSFPWVTWAKHEHNVNYDEILEILPTIKYGDIGIHRDNGYLSNVFIPGFMKHAWIHVEDGVESPQIVESISEGVIQRNAIYPLFSDFSIILSPKDATDEERKGACRKAKKVIGAEYDVDFKFDIEEELTHYKGNDKGSAIKSLQISEKHIKKHNYSFSCTETVSYAWWHKRDDLRLYRKRRRGKKVIIADDFINRGWNIKWLSASVTADAARKYKLHEEGLDMISDYWNDK